MGFFVNKNGIGWMSRNGDWNRIRPPWFPLLYSERYGDAVGLRFMGWRWSVRKSGIPWHATYKLDSRNDGE